MRDVAAIRRMLLAALLLLPATVVCKVNVCEEEFCNEDLPPATPATYEPEFGCDGGDVTVTAGGVSDVGDLGSCGFTPEAAASTQIGGVDASVEFLVDNGGNQITVTCAYEIGADLGAPLTCAGTTQRPLKFSYNIGSGTEQITAEISASEGMLADGADVGSFDAHVFVDCPFGIDGPIDLDGGPYTTPLIPLNGGSCNLEIELDSSASAAGQTFHSVSVRVNLASGTCRSDADCAGGLRCNPNGRCQDGGVGDLCTSPYVPATGGGGGDCNASAPICRTPLGISGGSCSTGLEGAACLFAGECRGDTSCVPVFFAGICQDGSYGDYCNANSPCQDPCECILAGNVGRCAGTSCPGAAGTPCIDAVGCDSALGCVPTGAGYSLCAPCTANAHCLANEICNSGVCLAL
jgi:hypothetical protein